MTVTEKLQEVAKFRHANTQQVIAEAVEIGVCKMWIDTVLGQYIDKKISQKKAVSLVGLDLVRLAEQQNKVAQSDVNWGLDHKGGETSSAS